MNHDPGEEASGDADEPERRVPAHRMRRFTDAEMDQLCALARSGRKGPVAAFQALWDLILREFEGLSWDEAVAASRRFNVQSYEIADDQATTLLRAMKERRNRRDKYGVSMMWLSDSPATYDVDR